MDARKLIPEYDASIGLCSPTSVTLFAFATEYLQLIGPTLKEKWFRSLELEKTSTTHRGVDHLGRFLVEVATDLKRHLSPYYLGLAREASDWVSSTSNMGERKPVIWELDGSSTVAPETWEDPTNIESEDPMLQMEDGEELWESFEDYIPSFDEGEEWMPTEDDVEEW